MLPYGLHPPASVSQQQNAALLSASGAITSNPLSAAVLAQNPAGLGTIPGALPGGLPGAALPGGALGSTLGAVRPPPTAAMQAGPYGLQPMLYWYPSPPVSPQSTFYVQACPTSVVMKGVHFNAQAQDILAFLEGIYEVRVQIILFNILTFNILEGIYKIRVQNTLFYINDDTHYHDI